MLLVQKIDLVAELVRRALQTVPVALRPYMDGASVIAR